MMRAERGARCALAAAALLGSRAVLGAEPGADGPPAPRAEALARPYSVVVSLERVLALGPYTEDGADGSRSLSLGAGGYLRTFDGTAHEPFLPHAAPRLALDVVLPEAFTLGVAGGFGLSVSETSSGYDSSPATTHTQKTALLTARVGFVAPVGRDSAFWPRVGITHAWGWGSELDSRASETRTIEARTWALAVDLPFVFMTSPNLGLVLDWSGDLGLAGTRRSARRDLAGTIIDDGGASRRVGDGFAVSLGALGCFP